MKIREKFSRKLRLIMVNRYRVSILGMCGISILFLFGFWFGFWRKRLGIRILFFSYVNKNIKIHILRIALYYIILRAYNTHIMRLGPTRFENMDAPMTICRLGLQSDIAYRVARGLVNCWDRMTNKQTHTHTHTHRLRLLSSRHVVSAIHLQQSTQKEWHYVLM